MKKLNRDSGEIQRKVEAVADLDRILDGESVKDVVSEIKAPKKDKK